MNKRITIDRNKLFPKEVKEEIIDDKIQNIINSHSLGELTKSFKRKGFDLSLTTKLEKCHY